MELFILTVFFLILNMLVLRKFAKEEMFTNYIMLLIFIACSFIPVINILALICFLIILLINKYEGIDDFAKALFFVKNKTKKDDVNDFFKGKRHR